MSDHLRPRLGRLSRRRVLAGGAALTAVAALLAAGGPAPAATQAPTAAVAPKPTDAAPRPAAADKPAEATKPAGAQPAAAAPGTKKLSGEVEFWSRETGDARQRSVRKRLDEFGQATGARPKVQFMIFQESVQKTQAAIAAGTLPDVGQQGQDVTMSFAGAGHLSPLDDTYKELGPQNFVQLQQKDAYVNWKGKLYGLPWSIETRILYYHRDLLDKAGVKPPKLWSEWVDAAKKLTQGEQFGYLYPFEGAVAGHVWISLAQSDGGTLLDKDGTIVAAESPGVTEGLQFAGDFYLKHKVMPEAAPTYKGTDANQLFYLKKVAMLYGNGQIIDDLVKTKPDLLPNVGAVLMPVNKPDQVTRSFLGGSQLFTFKASKNPEAGLELLKWLFQEPWYTDHITSTNGAVLPVTKAGVGADFFQKNELRKLLVTQAETALRYGGPFYGNTPYTGEAEAKLLFAQALTDLAAGKKSASEAVKELDSGLKELAKSSPT